MSSNIQLIQANIGMGLNHQESLSRGLVSMGAYFLVTNPDFFRKYAEVQSYINYIQIENPDIVYLTEICGIEQRDKIVDGLEKMGYKTHCIKGFELWNMQHDSHRFLYHIMGTKSNFEHKNTIQQFANNPIHRFISIKNKLGIGSPTPSNKVQAILDGGGSRYCIDGIEIGLLHSHAHNSTQVLDGLLWSLTLGKGSHQILAGDMNMQLRSVEEKVATFHPKLNRVETTRTFPHYFGDSGRSGIMTRAIDSLVQKYFLPYPDQAYISNTIHLIEQKALGPQQTGLKTDHTVNHYKFRTSSQSVSS